MRYFFSVGADAARVFDLLKAGEYLRAYEEGSAAMAAGNGDTELRARVAQAAVGCGETKRAQELLVPLVKEEQRAEYFGLLGEVLLKRGDHVRARAILKHALTIGGGRIISELYNVAQLEVGVPDTLSLVPGLAARHSEPPTMRKEAKASVPPPMRSEPKPSVPPPFRSEPKPSAPPPMRSEPKPSVPPPAAKEPSSSDPSEAGAVSVPQVPALAATMMAPDVLSAQARSLPAHATTMLASGGEVEHAAKLQPEVVMPRILGPEKPKDAAAAPLREAAAIGHHFIGDLLNAGLVSVPSVAELPPRPRHEVKKYRTRWGMTAERYIIFFAGLLVFIGAATAGWSYYRSSKRDDEAAGKVTSALGIATSGSLPQLRKAHTLVDDAKELQGSSSSVTLAYAEVEAALLILYGTKEGVSLPKRLSSLGNYKPGDDGYVRWLFAASVKEIVAPQGQAASYLNQINSLPESDRGPWLRYIKGELILRSGGVRAYEEYLAAFGAPAVENDPLLVIAKADYLFDRGDINEANALYQAVLKVHAEHTLALIGHAMARNALSKEPAKTGEILRVTLLKDLGRVETDEYANLGARGSAYRELALASTALLSEYYTDALASLEKAAASTNPRIQAGAAVVYLQLGDWDKAQPLVEGLPKWFEAHPSSKRVRAYWAHARGLPSVTLELTEGLDGMRDEWLRGKARFALGDAKAALDSFEKVHKALPLEKTLEVWKWAAQVAVAGDKQALKEIRKLARGMKLRSGRYLYGISAYRLGETGEAERQLRLSVDDPAPSEPAPQAHLAWQALAEYALEIEALREASEYVDSSRKANPHYLGLQGTAARVAMASGQASKGRKMLQKLMKTADAASWRDDVAWARLNGDRPQIVRSALTRAWKKNGARELIVEAADELVPGFSATLRAGVGAR